MSGVFICYRRGDTAGQAGRLYDRLGYVLGESEVFHDVDTMPPGVKFAPWIRDLLTQSSVVLVVIGREWLKAADESGRRRLELPGDWVRTEIEIALEWGITLIPVLVQGVPMPTDEELPETIRPIAEHQYFRLNEETFRPDADRLIDAIQRTMASKTSGRAERPTALDYSALETQVALEAEAEVFSVALSPDCRTVAAACGGFVAVWRSERHISGWTTDSPPEQHDRLFEGDRYVYAVRFSPDRGGQYLASADQDGWVQLAEVDGLRERWRHQPHVDAVYSVDFAPDLSLLATGAYDGKVHLLSVAKHGFPTRSTTRPGRVSCVAYSPRPEDRLVAVGNHDNTVGLWNLHDGTFKVLGVHRSSVDGLAFSPDGRQLASCGLDKSVRIWDLSNGEFKENVGDHGYLVRSVAFAPDGETLASASWDQTIKLWTRDDLSGDLIPTTLPFGTERHTDWIWSVDFLPGEGGVMASAGSDEKVILWSLPRG